MLRLMKKKQKKISLFFLSLRKMSTEFNPKAHCEPFARYRLSQASCMIAPRDFEAVCQFEAKYPEMFKHAKTLKPLKKQTEINWCKLTTAQMNAFNWLFNHEVKKVRLRVRGDLCWDHEWDICSYPECFSRRRDFYSVYENHPQNCIK